MSVIQGIGSDEVSTGFYPFNISNSLSFDDSSSDFLSFTPSGDGDNLKKYTISLWFKRSNLSTAFPTLIGANKSSGRDDAIRFGQLSGGDEIYIFFDEATKALKTDRVFRDVSAWYHLVLRVDTADSTDTERVKLYINGDIQTLTGTYPDINYEGGFNRAGEHTIGKRPQGNFYDGYIAEVNFIDGTALTPSSFGETKNDIWVAKNTSSLTFGTNGFRLQFQQSGTGTGSSSTIGADTSGRNNHFTSSGHPDQTLDSPTKNHATLGAQRILTHTLSDGNLKSTNSSGTHGGTTATFNYPTSGKWYHEVTIDAEDSSGGNGVGIGNQIDRDVTDWGNFANLVAYLSNGNKFIETGATSYGTGQNANNIVGVAFDADNQTLEFYLADSAGQTASSQGTIPTSEMDGRLDFNNLCPLVFGRNTGQTFNFGQSAFNGTDGSGTLPTGFKALNTANLADPGIDPAAGETPDEYFDSKLYSGNSSTHVITGLQFQPDFVWIKSRTLDISHALFDVLRGTSSVNTTNTALGSDRADAEGNANGVLSFFNSDGFTLDRGSSGNNNLKESLTNRSGETYVAWTWKAGGSGSSVSAGSISTGPNVPSIASTQSVSTETGFSIVSYQGNGTNDATVQHGLSQKPELSIIKNRSANSTNWDVSFEGITGGTSLNLDTTADVFTPTLGNHERGTQVLTLKDGSSGRTRVNTNSQNYIAYCFHSVNGYSKISIYKGNGSSDGTFVFTGFRPAWLIIKRFDGGAESWNIVDKKRNPFNGAKTLLRADLVNDEDDATNGIDLLSNGFKVRDNIGNYNTNDADYLYMAFADQPFKYSNAR